jgi:hypothetical protein
MFKESVCATLLKMMSAVPVPGDAFGGASFGPDRLTVKVNVAACDGMRSEQQNNR